MVNFDIFSVQCKRIVLIHFSSCQTSPGTSLESPNHIHASIFENLPFWASFGHLWACTGHLEPNHLLLVLYTCVRRCLTRFLRIHVDMFIQFIVNPIMSEKQQKWSILTTFLTFSQFNMIHFSSCQTSPVTSLEYPHHMHSSIFENWPFGPFWAIFEAVWAIWSQSTPCWFNLHLVRHLLGQV